MKLKKWHVCLAIVCILCFGYIMYIMNPEFDTGIKGKCCEKNG